LFERHVAAVTRFFRNKVDRDVDDLVQETFLGCLEAAASFRGQASLRSFLLGIARHKLYDRFARARRTSFDPVTQSVVDLGTSPSSAVARGQEQRLLLEELRAVPLEYQVVLELAYWEDLSGEEIAGVLAVPHNTVRSRLSRARAALERALERLAESPEVLRSTRSDLEGWARGLAAPAD
jgi:RNA polymerase sigma-70 factor (ECF subfamily)